MTNLDLGRFALGLAALLLIGQAGLAANNSSALQWGRPQVARRMAKTVAKNRPVKQPVRVFHDSRVVAASWEEDGAPEVRQAAVEDRSVVVQRPAPAYDPFDEDDRLAQLPDDPFDEPIGELIPEPEEDIIAVEDAIEEEIQRRQSADDLLEEEMDNLLNDDPFEGGPPEDLDEMNPFDDEPTDEPTGDASDEDKLELSQDDEKTPDLDLDFNREDPQDEDPADEDPADEDGLTPEELEEQRKELAEERRVHEESCREELKDLASNRISSIDLGIRVKGNAGEDFPYECSVSSQSHQPRQWPEFTYNWKAAALCHKPLYFEQVQLERYGHSWGPYVQPIMSGVHFFGTLPILPYKMGIRTPCECVYTLGYYRPGSCAPYMIDPIPFTWRAAFFEGAVATGISFVIP